MTDLQTLPETERGTNAPTRYRNWWLFHEAQWFQCVVCGHEEDVTAGDMRQGHCKTYATIDEATAAARELDAHSDPAIQREWLGAFPDGSRP